MSFNKVILIGNLTADPELKQTPSGVSVCRFSVAVQRKGTKGDDKKVDFINCVAWRQTAEFITKWFAKGKPILVEGEINVEKYEKDGAKRYDTHITVSSVNFVAGAKEDARGGQLQGESNKTQGSPEFSQSTAQWENVNPDEGLPF